MYRESDPRHYGGVPPGTNSGARIVPRGEGAPIVDVARALRARRRGEVALSNGVTHPEAKEILDIIYEQAPPPEKQE